MDTTLVNFRNRPETTSGNPQQRDAQACHENLIHGEITPEELERLSRDGYGGASGWEGRLPYGI